MERGRQRQEEGEEKWGAYLRGVTDVGMQPTRGAGSLGHPAQMFPRPTLAPPSKIGMGVGEGLGGQTWVWAQFPRKQARSNAEQLELNVDCLSPTPTMSTASPTPFPPVFRRLSS